MPERILGGSKTLIYKAQSIKFKRKTKRKYSLAFGLWYSPESRRLFYFSYFEIKCIVQDRRNVEGREEGCRCAVKMFGFHHSAMSQLSDVGMGAIIAKDTEGG